MASSSAALPTLTPTSASSAASSAPSTASSVSNGPSSASASATASSNPASSNSASSNSASSSAPSSATASRTITDAPSLSTSSVVSNVSSLTGAPSLTSGNIPQLTDAPTLSGFYSYPPPSVPPRAGAPYLQKNNLPENFVFIIVGACIAFVAFVIIGWRILTSWSINRRFRRHDGTATTVSYTPLADFKQKPAMHSNHDMKDVNSGTHAPALPKNFSSGAPTSLFFSPTAEVARQSQRPASSRVESGVWMPGGHYRDGSDPARR